MSAVLQFVSMCPVIVCILSVCEYHQYNLQPYTLQVSAQLSTFDTTHYLSSLCLRNRLTLDHAQPLQWRWTVSLWDRDQGQRNSYHNKLSTASSVSDCTSHRTQSAIIIKTRITRYHKWTQVFMKSAWNSCLILTKIGMFWQRLIHILKIKLYKSLSSVCCTDRGQTAGQTDTQNEANRCFLQLQHEYVPKLFTQTVFACSAWF
jgi:hypothetical protein